MMTESNIAVAIRAGDQEVFQQLFESKLAQQVAAFVFSIVHNREDAEEITSEAFLKLWRTREKIINFQHLKNRLFIIARNESLNFLKKDAKRKGPIITGLTDQQIDQHIPQELLIINAYLDSIHSIAQCEQYLRAHLSGLLAGWAQAYRLRYLEDLTHKEIAEKMNISKKTVSNYISEARGHILELLKKSGHLRSLFILSLFSLCHSKNIHFPWELGSILL